MKKILVIGSYNVGLTVIVPKIPKPGETIMGTHFDMGPGGKGSNQAIAVARLGGDVRFMARLGDDIFGQQALELFERENMDMGLIRTVPGVHSGVGLIFLDDNAQNAIGVAGGANLRLGIEDIEERPEVFSEIDFLLMQLETPVPTVFAAARKAKESGVTTILNPAPACPLDDELLMNIDLLTPNESEAETLTGFPVHNVDDAIRAGHALRNRGVRQVIVTLGDRGSVLVDAQREFHCPAFSVHAVDTTGAGDAYNGALVTALAEGLPMDEAMTFASRAAAYSVMHLGVVPGLPRRDDLKGFC